LFHDVVRDDFHMDAHAFPPIHFYDEVEIFDVRCHELGAFCGDDTVEETDSFLVEIFDVRCHELGAFCGDDTVEEDFDSCKVRDGSADWSVVIGSIAASSETNTVLLAHVCFVGDYYSATTTQK
jgi:hypothetical protein